MRIKNIAFTTVLALQLVACTGMPEAPVDPQSLTAAKANTQLGVEYLRSGDYDRSRHRLEKAIKLAPGYAPAHGAIAILYERVGDTEAAEKHYRKTLRLDPKNAGPQNNYGQFLCQQGRYKEAEDAFAQAAENAYYRTPWVPLTNAGYCLMSVPNMTAAEVYFRQALEKQPKYAPALMGMGKISFKQGNYLNTRGYLQRYQQVGKHSAESLWLAIRTEHALGDHQAWGNYALMLRKDFPDSEEYLLLQEWENERRSAN